MISLRQLPCCCVCCVWFVFALFTFFTFTFVHQASTFGGERGNFPRFHCGTCRCRCSLFVLCLAEYVGFKRPFCLDDFLSSRLSSRVPGD